jgi:hypothetical protein
MKNSFDYALPDASGYFGEYGGCLTPGASAPITVVRCKL